MAGGIDSDYNVAYLSLLSQLVLAVLSAHGPPEPLGSVFIHYLHKRKEGAALFKEGHVWAEKEEKR